MARADAPTPMMAQYLAIRDANPGALLFYRMGDFYELFFEDAEIASRALGIALTKRGKHLGQDIPMCGVPVHSADDYLQRLIATGHRVAVCEQIEDPRADDDLAGDVDRGDLEAGQLPYLIPPIIRFTELATDDFSR